MITNARWANEEQTSIICEIDGRPSQVPVNDLNADYQEIIRSGVEVHPPAVVGR
jgi:hypothetical protein